MLVGFASASVDPSTKGTARTSPRRPNPKTTRTERSDPAPDREPVWHEAGRPLCVPLNDPTVPWVGSPDNGPGPDVTETSVGCFSTVASGPKCRFLQGRTERPIREERARIDPDRTVQEVVFVAEIEAPRDVPGGGDLHDSRVFVREVARKAVGDRDEGVPRGTGPSGSTALALP